MRVEKTAGVQRLRDCVVLGGSGFPFPPGESVEVVVDGSSFNMRGQAFFANVLFWELAELTITGPGTVQTGGGFVGGGFGVEGAVEGMAVAGVLNLLTSRTKTHTFISLVTNFGELHLHYGGMEPSALRIALSDVFVKMRRMDPKWLPSRLELLQAELERNALTHAEFETLQTRLVSGPSWVSIAAETQRAKVEQDTKYRDELEKAPKGICPNCDTVIALHAESCPKCKAAFGVGSVWTVTPIAG